MSGCREFGEWTSIVHGELPARESYGVAAHLLRCDACRSALADARRLDSGLRAVLGRDVPDPRDHAVHEDLVALAAAIARGEFPPEAWACEDCTEVLIASIGSTKVAGTHPRRPRVGPRWLAGALAAAALIVALLAVGPPSQQWARAAGLRRGQVWLLPSSIAKNVERAVSSGEIAPPRFSLPMAPLEIERDPTSVGDAPRALSPRWEAVGQTRPEFRWAGGEASRAEVFLLDQHRRFLRSFETEKAGRMEYPTSAPPLTPGASYYWKINLGGVEVRASAYVGFAVLGADESRACDRSLARVALSPFVEAVVAERCGFYSRAAAAFDRAAARAYDPEVAARLAREIRHRQGLDEDETRE